VSNKKFMVDVEAIGDMPGGVILSIGWVRFRPDLGPDLETAKEVRLDIDLQLSQGLKVNSGPINFWLDQKAKPWGPELDEHAAHPVFALDKFNQDMRGASEVWAKPPTYDLTGIRSCMAAFEMVPSWSFRAECCLRTLFKTGPQGLRQPPLADGTKHGALADAIHQATDAAAMLKAMRQ